MHAPQEHRPSGTRTEEDLTGLLVLEYLQALFGVSVLVAVALGGMIAPRGDEVTGALAIGLFLSVAFLCLAVRTRMGHEARRGEATAPSATPEVQLEAPAAGHHDGPYRSPARPVVARPVARRPAEPLASRLRCGVLATGAMVAMTGACAEALLRGVEEGHATSSAAARIEAPRGMCTDGDDAAGRSRARPDGVELLRRSPSEPEPEPPPEALLRERLR